MNLVNIFSPVSKNCWSLWYATLQEDILNYAKKRNKSNEIRLFTLIQNMLSYLSSALQYAVPENIHVLSPQKGLEFPGSWRVSKTKKQQQQQQQINFINN